jgi:hypothetical protein
MEGFERAQQKLQAAAQSLQEDLNKLFIRKLTVRTPARSKA